jgi:hypothetical protein
VIVVAQVAFELEPQPALDALLLMTDDEMMLLRVGNIIQNKVRVASIGELK